ncbi:unnamed protein product, partial [Didymodactylos carnosus]
QSDELNDNNETKAVIDNITQTDINIFEAETQTDINIFEAEAEAHKREKQELIDDYESQLHIINEKYTKLKSHSGSFLWLH